MHLRAPQTSDDIRIDAGFVEGDEISSHYDPMIAKLIVRAPDRQNALKKLRIALENYEIAGLKTNIVFLKSLCQSQDFVSGLVETGFVSKHQEELFRQERVADEVWAQAALGVLLQEVQEEQYQRSLFPAGSLSGFSNGLQSREVSLNLASESSDASSGSLKVIVQQISRDQFHVSIPGRDFGIVTAKLNRNHVLESFYQHTRLTTTVLKNENQVTLFQQGAKYDLQISNPTWIEKALGVKDAANSVVAPMPCKVLRIDIE